LGASDHATRQATVLDAEAPALPATTSVETNAGASGPGPSTTASAGPPTDSGRSRLGHRPALDGLRGIAVVAVVLYHVGQVIWPEASGWLAPGGFAGVDLFFALSGFLITTLMLEEAGRRHSVDLGGFLERRAVRLVPALAAALATIFVLALFGYGDHTPQDLLRRSVWNLAFLQNWKSQWRLITDLGHTWSLALEGQFYVLWSVTVAAVVAATRGKPQRRLPILLGIAGVTAAAVCIYRALRYGDHANPYILYLSTTTRIDGPLIGSIAGIAFVSGWFDRLSPRRAAVAVAIGLTFFAVCVMTIDPFEGFLYQGGLTLYAVAAAIVVVATTALTGGRVHGALTVRPLVLLGTISYSLFLWHIPVFFTIERSASDWPVAVKVLVGLSVSLLLAVASYRLVEQPFLRISRDARARRAGQSPGRWLIAGARAWVGARTRPNGASGSNGTDGTNGKGSGTEGDASAEVVGIDGLRPSDRQRLRKAWVIAGTPVLLLYTWILTAGSGNLFQRQYFDSFFDAQGRSLLDGRWDVPPEVVGFEGFLVNGRTYIYFGPLPALLRMPILAVTHRLDGRLTTLSMLAATLLLAWATFRLTTAVRGYVRGQAPVTRTEVIATGFLAVAVLCGTPFWLGAETAVYHEAALWAVAFMVAALASLARWMLDPRNTRLAVASGLIAATLLTRQTLGFGGLVALGCIGLAVLKDRIVAHRHQRPQRVFVGARMGVLLLAGLVPLAISIAPNMARFDKPFGVPIDRHVYTLQNEDRQEFLEANDGSFFGPQFLATNLVQYFRPDAFDVRPDLPWIDYPRSGPKIIGDVVFDGTGWSSSIPVTMPILTGLALVGTVLLTRSALRRRPEKWLVALYVGAAVGTLGVATIGYVAHRYMNDFYPAVLLPAVVGFHVAVRRFQLWRDGRAEAIDAAKAERGADAATPGVIRARQRGLQRRVRGIVVGLAAVLAFGVFANTAMALEYQRERGPAVPEWRRSAWIKARATLPFSKEPAEVPLRFPLPEDTWDGRLGVVGDCDALYVRVGDNWLGVERGPSVGVYDLRVDLHALVDLPDGQRAPLLTLGSGYDATVVAVTRTTGNRARFDVWSGAEQGWDTWMPQDIHGVVNLRVDTDRYQPPNQITHDGATVYAGAIPRSDAFALVGEGPELPGLVDTYPGDIALTPNDRSICHAVTD
jgi:peptidoglycan/LPS O-acetylase OafA/YrhL